MKIINKSVEIAKAMFPAEYDSRQGYQAFHFCFIWKRTNLLSVGVNDVDRMNGRMVTFAQKFNVPVLWPYMHAEIDAVAKLWGRYHVDHSLKVVVLRLNKELKLRDSRPCKICMPILSQLGLTNKLWYSVNNKIVRLEVANED